MEWVWNREKPGEKGENEKKGTSEKERKERR